MKVYEAVIDGNKHTFVCDVEPGISPANPLAFAHTCVYLLNGEEYSRVRVTYEDRAHELYPYRTVLHKAIDTIEVNSALGGDYVRYSLKDIFDGWAEYDRKARAR